MFTLYRDISNVYKEMGNYRLALNNFESYSTHKDSSLQEENLKQISELETKYETDRIERENVLLNTENALQEAQNKRQKIFLMSVIGISVMPSKRDVSERFLFDFEKTLSDLINNSFIMVQQIKIYLRATSA